VNSIRRPRWFLPAFVVLFVACLGLSSALWGGLRAAAVLLGCVFVHEMGHVLAARLCGAKSSWLVLPEIGGLTRVGGPLSPAGELACLAGGLAFSSLVAASLLLATFVLPSQPRALAAAFGVVVCGLNLLNALPVVPLDGGRLWSAAAAELPRGPRLGIRLAMAGTSGALAFALKGSSIDVQVLRVLLALSSADGLRRALSAEDARDRPVGGAASLRSTARALIALALWAVVVAALVGAFAAHLSVPGSRSALFDLLPIRPR
jgi:Zn-dependent protease